MCCTRRAAPLLPLVVLVLLLALLMWAGCTNPENYCELGPLFVPEEPPPGQARVYVFWPAASPASRGVYQLSRPASVGVEQLLPGGYLSHSAVPGMTIFEIDREWELGSRASPSWMFAPSATIGPKLAITVAAGQVYYLRVAPRPGLVDQLALEPVATATGQAEIQRCHLVRWKSARFAGRAQVP
jgi:hypothetical protein